jgi:hypothetical protein
MTSPSSTDPTPSPLRWTVHPAAEHPARAVLVLLVIALVTALVASVSGSPLLALVGSLLLAGSLRAYFLPRTYVLDAVAAQEHGPLQSARRLPWSEVRAITRERHGVHLSPLHRPSRWAPDRGLFLRTAGNAERVAAFALERRGA